MTAKIKVGDIVTVVSDESDYGGEQGQVVQIVEDDDSDGPIGVKFNRSQMMHYVDTDAKCIVRHLESELRIDATWNIKTRAEQLYPGHYHSLMSLWFDFDARNPCMHEECSKQVARRCLLNYWGTVYELDLCTKHAEEIDGVMTECFPVKKDYEPLNPPPKKEAA